MSLGDGRGSALLGELGRAQVKIRTLEDFIRERERQFHTAVSRLHGAGARRTSERRSSRFALRQRRAGITQETLVRMRTFSQDSADEDIGAFSQPLGEYICLKLIRIQDDPSSDVPIPFHLQWLVGRQYHVGPETVTIGNNPSCRVCVPKEADVWERHAAIRWNTPGSLSAAPPVTVATRRGSQLSKQACIDEQGWFDLCDLTEGKSLFRVLDSPLPQQNGLPVIRIDSDRSEDGPTSSQIAQIPSQDGPDPSPNNASTGDTLSPFCTKLLCGVQFQTGRLVWSLAALPFDQVMTIKLFRMAHDGDLNSLRTLLDDTQCNIRTQPYVFVSPRTSSHTPYRFSTVSIVSEAGVDVNTEYQPPTFGEDTFLTQLVGRRQSSLLSSHSPPLHPSPYHSSFPHTSPQSPRLLLHIAVQNNDLAMTQYLLAKGARVNLTSGDLCQTSMHLASQCGLPDVMHVLLSNGGDAEIRDALHRTPLEVASFYEIRKLLLNCMLLCAAAEAGDEEEAARLLSRPESTPNGMGLRHKTALHLAASSGHLAVVDLLLSHGADAHARGGSKQRTALHYASLHNHVAVATRLLTAGANEHCRDVSGQTALNLSMGGEMCKLLHKQPLSLCLAVQGGDVQSVRQLLEEKAERKEEEKEEEEKEKEMDNLVNQRNEQSHAPLHIACISGNLELAQLLISHGAKPSLHGGSDGWTPLFYAAMAGHTALVEFLLSVGASTEEMDCYGNSVEGRVESAMEEIQGRLGQLKKGKSVSQVQTPIQTLDSIPITRQESSTSYSAEMEQVWLSRRYSQLHGVAAVLIAPHQRLLKAVDTRNMTDFLHLLDSGAVGPDEQVGRPHSVPVLTHAAELGLFSFAQELIKRGAQVSPSGTEDQIPLLVAAAHGHTDILQLLLAHGANINYQSEDTLTTALHEAAGSNCLETVQLLLSQGADKMATNCDGETPFDCTAILELRELLAAGPNCLLMAACTGDSQALRRLINEEGLPPSLEFQQGMTTLHEACEGCHGDCVAALLELGADVNKQTRTMQTTPLHIASRNNFVSIAAQLLKAGAKLDLKDADGKVPFEVASTNQMRKVLIEARSVRAAPVPLQRETSREVCRICMDHSVNTIILPCGHQAFCTSCVSQISVCALDRQPIREVITIYK